ncbi:MAG: DinB family protein [Thermomicrobiales bacterium]
MDLVERLIGHDLWTTGELLRRCRELSDTQLDQDIDIDHRTVRATLTHMIWNIETWSDLMLGVPIDRNIERSETLDGLAQRHQLAGKRFHALARRLADGNRLEETWTDVLDQPPTEKTYGGAIAHVITHDMHHRAQLLYMLDKLGLRALPEGDLLGWEMNYRFQ